MQTPRVRRFGHQRNSTPAQTASVFIEAEENEDGIEVPCVYAMCDETGEQVGPIWGDGDASVKRALATLTEECSCGATWHREE